MYYRTSQDITKFAVYSCSVWLSWQYGGIASEILGAIQTLILSLLFCNLARYLLSLLSPLYICLSFCVHAKHILFWKLFQKRGSKCDRTARPCMYLVIYILVTSKNISNFMRANVRFDLQLTNVIMLEQASPSRVWGVIISCCLNVGR
jgi:hypothetical protein